MRRGTESSRLTNASAVNSSMVGGVGVDEGGNGGVRRCQSERLGGFEQSRYFRL